MEPTPAQIAATHAPWRPSPDEVAGILAEMRPIIADFTRRAAAFLASASADSEAAGFAVPKARMAAGFAAHTY